MNTVQQEEANLDALTREVAGEKTILANLKTSLDEATERGDNDQIGWVEKEIEEHKKVLKAAENCLIEAAGTASPRARRGRPPLQKRAE